MKRRSELVQAEIPKSLAPWLEGTFPQWRAEGSGGKGGASLVPWSRYFDPKLSPRATRGWYVVYLFSATGDAVYLSVNQGTTTWSTDLKSFIFREPKQLIQRVQWARSSLAAGPGGLQSFGDVVLHSRAQLVRGYERGNVHAVRYEAGAIPAEDELRNDFIAMGRLLARLYQAEAEAIHVPGDEPPEIFDALSAAESTAGNARHQSKGRKASGQGRGLSAAEKLAIERHSVKMASEHFEKLGYKVEDKGVGNPYDLLATKGQETIYVEVKGTVTQGAEVVLTYGEVEHHRKHYPNNALALVHSIHLDRSGATPGTSGGVLQVKRGWEIDEEALRPISYRYQTPAF